MPASTMQTLSTWDRGADMRITYRGFAGNYMQPPEPAEGIMDAVCDPDEYDDACGWSGEVDVVGDGEVWDWECGGCKTIRTTYLDMNGE